MGRRLGVRILRYGSLALAVLGLVVLFGVAKQSVVPSVPVGGLGATMNWAYVQIEGVVSREPAHDTESGALKFWVRDPTGEIMVTAYRAQAEVLAASGQVPAMGDSVSVAGTLRVRDDFSYLVLDVPDHLAVQRAAVLDLPIGDVTHDLLYRRVRVCGQVRADRTPYAGQRILTLVDTTGQIELLLPREGAAPERLAIGESVEVVGAVDEYRGLPQLSVGGWEDVRLLDHDVVVAPARTIDELGAGDVGQMVTVEGTIAWVQPFSAGVKLLLAERGGSITLLFWQDVYALLPAAASLMPGARVRVVGEVAEYRGEIEIIPSLPSDVTVVALPAATSTRTPLPTTAPTCEPTPEPTVQLVATAWLTATIQPTAPATDTPTGLPTPAPTATPTGLPPAQPANLPTLRLGDITRDHLGTTLTVAQAGIADVVYLSKGVKYTITDATGTLTLLVWQDVLEGVAGHLDLLPGSRVQVTGEIDEYQGEIEIVPAAGSDVVVLDRGPRLPVEAWPVSRISASDQGRVLVVAGRVVHIEGDRWLNVRLNDGTGEIVVYLPERLVPYLPPGIGPGATLRVAGQVDVYHGTLELIPLAAADVQVEP
ncbi:MAG: hypothetical protein JXA93_09780 [Anaerolineae bacterium]|nr:hypothetical protein [Anaerolineae bacterium]